jgi:hypothetical protein
MGPAANVSIGKLFMNPMREYGNSSVTIRIPQSRIEQVASLA